MDIRPIKTEADYAAALAAIRKLMNAKPSTPEGERLEVLGWRGHRLTRTGSLA